MTNLGMKNLLVIAPHVKVFIRDQITRLSQYVNRTDVLIPVPHFAELVRRIPRIGEKFSFLDWALESPKELDQLHLHQIRYLTAPIDKLRKQNHIRFSKACLNAVKRRNFDPHIIHTHFLDHGAAGARIKAATGSSLVMTVHGADVYDIPFRNTYYHNEAKRILKEADTIISVSKYNARRLEKLGIEPQKINVIPNGFASSLFKLQSKNTLRKQLGLPTDRPVITNIGRLAQIKGHSVLLKAMTELIKSKNSPYLVIVGHGSLRKQLGEIVRQFGISDSVRFIGSIPHANIASWIGASDLFVLPSLRESFPTVIPEALACGRPVIASRVGGIPEIINDKNVGSLVQPGSVNQLSDAIRQALDQQWDPEYIAAHAHPYSFKYLIPKIVEVYEKLL